MNMMMMMMMMMMLEKVKATPSDSLMRLLQQINKQGLAVDFLLRRMCVPVCMQRGAPDSLSRCAKQTNCIYTRTIT